MPRITYGHIVTRTKYVFPPAIRIPKSSSPYFITAGNNTLKPDLSKEIFTIMGKAEGHKFVPQIIFKAQRSTFSSSRFNNFILTPLATRYRASKIQAHVYIPKTICPNLNSPIPYDSAPIKWYWKYKSRMYIFEIHVCWREVKGDVISFIRW